MEHKVFVYGTLREGEKNSIFISNVTRENATAHGMIFDTGFGFPNFSKDGDGEVVGEVITVDDRRLRIMDHIEGYPWLYNRETITVNCNGKETEALVYIMRNNPSNCTKIESGDWVFYRKTRNAK